MFYALQGHQIFRLVTDDHVNCPQNEQRAHHCRKEPYLPLRGDHKIEASMPDGDHENTVFATIIQPGQDHRDIKGLWVFQAAKLPETPTKPRLDFLITN